MNDPLPNAPRFGEPQSDVTRQITQADWERTELDAQSAPIPPRERLFPRKVLVGWALFALALYFGVTMVGRILKETVKSAVVNAADQSGQKDIIFRTRDGHVTISRDKPNGSISITTSERPGHPSKTVIIPGAAATIPPTPKPPTTVTVNGDGVTVTHPPAAPAPTKR
jgi:hypothetical protein